MKSARIKALRRRSAPALVLWLTFMAFLALAVGVPVLVHAYYSTLGGVAGR